MPVTKSWEQLAKDAHGNSTLAKELDSMDESTRASMGGQVSGNLTYPEWFDAQSEARQLDILGPKKLALYQKGALDFVSMLNQQGNVLTLKQLEEIVG